MTGQRQTRRVVNYTQLSPAPVVLIAGPEDALADRAARLLRKQLMQRYTDLAIHDINAEKYVSGELISVASPSLFGEPRLIRIAALEKAGHELLEDFQHVAANQDQETFISLRHAGGNGGKALLTAARKIPGLLEVDCVRADQRRRGEIVQLAAKHLGVSLAPDALQQLSGAFAQDLGELLAVLEQLAATVTDKKITKNTVLQLTQGRAAVTSFAVANAAMDGNVAQTLTQLRHALHEGVDPIAILGAVNVSLRDLARVYNRPENSAQLAVDLKKPQWAIERVRRYATKWQERDLARTVQFATEVEVALKGGARNREFNLERLLLRIAVRGRF